MCARVRQVEADLKKTGASFEGGDDQLENSLHRVCSKQGHLLKRGRRRASWKRRYFCLCDQEVFYYYTAEMSNPFQPLGIINFGPQGDMGDRKSSVTSLDGMDTSPGATPPASSRTVPVIIQPYGTGVGSLPRLYSFAVHTPGRTWHLAAESAEERDDWVRVLCACGGQLSASSSDAALSPPPTASPAASASSAAAGSNADGSAPNTEDMSKPPVQGLLWKRASKVHIAQRSEAETGQGRDWVARHFALHRAEYTLEYRQNASDPASAVRGIVPLSSYERVEPTQGPREHLPFAFRLVPRGGGASPDSSFIFAAGTEEERDHWIDVLSTALVEAKASQTHTPTPELTRRGVPAAAAAASAGDALAPQLASASIS